MITLIQGENTFLVERELRSLGAHFDGDVERYEGTVLTGHQLPDLLSGAMLFTDKRLIIIKNLSENKELWTALGSMLEREPSNDLVIVEAKPDKRTKAYKMIAGRARVIPVEQLTDRDWRQAESWLDEYAHSHKVKLTRHQLSDMVQRAMVPDTKPGRQLIDQQLLATAVDALTALPSVDDTAIETVMPESSLGTVFDILHLALTGERAKVRELMNQLRHHDEAMAVFPSLMSQWVQLVEIALVGERAAGELGIHPYVAQKLSGLAKSVPRDRVKPITLLGARLDSEMKRSSIEPWDAIDRFVLELTIKDR